MSRARVDRLAAAVSALVAKRLGERAAPLAVAALEADGFRVHGSWADGLSVDEAPGLDSKLTELEGQGIRPGLVVVIRSFCDEATP